MKLLCMACLLLITQLLPGQSLYLAEQGRATFLSTAPVEDIKAENNEVKSAYSKATQGIAVKVFIKKFHFDNQLMQDHFNENYLESHKYPEATFTGAVIDRPTTNTPGKYPATAQGELTVHGVKKPRTLRGVWTVNNDGTLVLEADFDIELSEHKIKIPKMFYAKIAEKVSVHCLIHYAPGE